jgi:hypothetical protein
MSQTSIAAEIATRTAAAERKLAVALGHDAIDVFDLWSRAYFETFNRAWDAPRPAVNLPLRMIGNMT